MEELIEKKGFASIHDCAVGSGVMLIAAANEAASVLGCRYNWQNHLLFVGQDVSKTAGLMAYIQLSLLGCAGYIKIGDSLSDPIYAGDSLDNYWFTPLYFSDVWEVRRALHRHAVLIDPHK
jgi:type I restriction-modification system DNA methylase subunit